MTIPRIKRSIISTAAAGGAALALTAPVGAVTIPDGGLVQAGAVNEIHFRILQGCDGAETTGLVVTIPEGITNVIPEAMPGWTTEIQRAGEAAADATEPPTDEGALPSPGILFQAPEDRVTSVRWSGGSLPADQYMEFGLRASFPDDDGGTLDFPAIQECGDIQVAWEGDAPNPAPTVTIGERVGPRDLADLAGAVTTLEETVTQLEERIGDVNVVNLRERVRELETAAEDLTTRDEELTTRINRLRDRIIALEEANGEQPANGAAGETPEPAANG